MHEETALRAYLTRVERELRHNILPFWMEHAVDRARGGFYGEIENDLTIHPEAPKGALQSARILWTYAAAYRRYGTRAYLEMARWAYDDLVQRFLDPVHGGFYWMISADGRPLQPRKQIYGQAFGIYALAEYYAATHDAPVLELAQETFELVEQHSFDPVHGGYYEACTQTWDLAADTRLSPVDLNEKKSMNTHLHVMEAYTNLLRVWPDDRLRRQLRGLLEVMLMHIVDPATGHMRLFFDEAWRSKLDHISYGHDIEASWLLVETAEVLDDADLNSQVRELAITMAQAVLDEGLDPDGGLVYEMGPSGLTDSTKQWWPQAEAAVGFLNAYQLSGTPHFLEASLRSWDFIEAYLVDVTYGEWIRYVTRDHRPAEGEGSDDLKASFWKCPYHNARACMEVSRRLQAILNL